MSDLKQQSNPKQFYISGLVLDNSAIRLRSDIIINEIRSARLDLLENNSFTLLSGLEGPYHLKMKIIQNRIVFDIKSDSTGETEELMIPTSPFRRLVKDYFMICESYYDVLKSNVAKIQAIDAGRRAIHNEAADVLIEVLKDKIALDHNTARRLFTFIASLHIRQGQY